MLGMASPAARSESADSAYAAALLGQRASASAANPNRAELGVVLAAGRIAGSTASTSSVAVRCRASMGPDPPQENRVRG